MWGRPEKGPWPLPSETPLRRKTGSPSPNQEPSTPWRGRSHGGDHRARVRKDEACPAEEWPRTQTPHLDMFRALSLTHTRVSQPQAPKVGLGTRSPSWHTSPPPPRPSQPELLRVGLPGLRRPGG